jgi:UDP-4-amino-4-deoxy-L-arabinose-oxoglutarate aminotransferase
MVVSDDEALLTKVKSLKFHGLGVDAFDRQTHGRAPQAQVIQPGYKYNLTDISAVLGLGQLSRLETFNARRAELAARYREQLSEIPELIPLAVPQHELTHAWHLFIVRLDTDKVGIDRDAFMATLKEKNIGTGLHFRAVHLQKYYMDALGMKRGMLPKTEWNSDRIFSLPLCPSMLDSDVDDVVSAMKQTLSEQ